MTNIQYDPAVILSFASALYARASTLVVTYALLGGLFGAFAGLAVGGGIGFPAGLVPLLVLVALGAVLGRSMAIDRANQLKLQAQTALCQVMIAEHARVTRTVMEAGTRA